MVSSFLFAPFVRTKIKNAFNNKHFRAFLSNLFFNNQLSDYILAC